MSDNLQPGDLVTAAQYRGGGLLLESADSMIARLPGTWEWTLLIPRSSIMTIIKMPPSLPPMPRHHAVVTVLHDGMLLEVSLIDIQRLDGAGL